MGGGDARPPAGRETQPHQLPLAARGNPLAPRRYELPLSSDSAEGAAIVRLTVARDVQSVKRALQRAGLVARLSASEWAGQRSPRVWAFRVLPLFQWVSEYKRSELLDDVVAGVSLGAMEIPQALSYAVALAGLSPQIGLYAAWLPCWAYVLFGSGKQVSLGPTAISALLTGEALTKIVGALPAGSSVEETAAWQQLMNTAANQIALIAFIILCSMSVLRLGNVVQYLSHPVLSGFVSGAAVVILFTQLKYIVGYDIGQGASLPGVFGSCARLFTRNHGASEWHWRETVMGLCWLLLLVGMKAAGGRWKKLYLLKSIGPLTVVIASTLLVWKAQLDGSALPPSARIHTVGKVPGGVPAVSAGKWLPLVNPSQLVASAVEIALLAYVESFSISQTLAMRNNYAPPKPSQELWALGFCNLIAALFSAMPVTGSFTRTALADVVGSRTQLANFITGTTVMIALLALTRSFKHLPTHALAAIVISAVFPMMDFAEPLRLFLTSKADAAAWLVSFGGVLLFGVEIGLAVGVGFSFALGFAASMLPELVVLGRLPGTDAYRDVRMFAIGRTYAGLLVLRIEGSLFFANASRFQRRLRALIDACDADGPDALGDPPPVSGGPVRALVLDFCAVPFLDTTATHVLLGELHALTKRGVIVTAVNPSRSVLAFMERAGMVALLGADRLHVQVHDAVMQSVHLLRKRDALAAAGTGSASVAAAAAAAEAAAVALEEEEASNGVMDRDFSLSDLQWYRSTSFRNPAHTNLVSTALAALREHTSVAAEVEPPEERPPPVELPPPSEEDEEAAALHEATNGITMSPAQLMRLKEQLGLGKGGADDDDEEDEEEEGGEAADGDAAAANHVAVVVDGGAANGTH